MERNEKNEILEQIENLPKGNITVKHINGKAYEYWQFRENGKQVTKRVKGEELEILQQQIKERKRLESLIDDSKQIIHKKDDRQVTSMQKEDFHSFIRIGAQLKQFAEPVRSFKKREIFQQLHDYIYGPHDDRVFVLYGLRRTGKTTLIRQIILEAAKEVQSRMAFIQVRPNDTMASLNQDLKLLEMQGFQYIFIDEVTLLSDFIEGASLLSDIFAASGMKIVLSGTDSLGFMFAEDEQLYDRCELLHTTFIPYREFERVLGICGVDEYIRYGGTMSLGGIEYNEDRMLFSSRQRTNEYIDTAIARNIQHSLKNYQYEGHFRELYDLYKKNELTSAVNRVIEDMNHRFTIEVMTETFKSHDLGISASNLRKDRNSPNDILDHVDVEKVTKRLKSVLEIRNKNEQTIRIGEEHVKEIREYLELLDLIQEVDVIASGSVKRNSKRIVFTQPGLCYAQAKALVTSLMQDDIFLDLGIKERMRITDCILDEIRGRMMEDIILLETKMSSKKKQVFVLQFVVGEFDMVIFDPETISCRLFEIKHSKEIVSNQYRHLIDAKKLEQTERQYGDIEGRYVIYNGEPVVQDGIQYVNVRDYLLSMGN